MAAPSCTWSPPTPQDTSSSVSGAATVEGVLGWRTPGAGEPTQQAITFYLCRPVAGSGGKLPGVKRGGEGRLGAERGWAREGRVAGSLCSVGFTWLLWGRVTPGRGLPVTFVPALITWSPIAVFYAKSVLQQR